MNRFLLPLGIFIVLVGFLAVGLRLNPREIPSPLIDKPAPGGGQANPLCAKATKKEDDPSENARSLGVLVTFGSFKFFGMSSM